MSLRLRFSDQADTDLDEIWSYAAEYNAKTADQKIARIITTCFALTDTPELGRRREEFRVGLRGFRVGNHLVFYRVWPERIDIIRIVHGARNLEELLTTDVEETFDDE